MLNDVKVLEVYAWRIHVNRKDNPTQPPSTDSVASVNATGAKAFGAAASKIWYDLPD